MTSYDVGYLFGYMLASKWVKKSLVLPDENGIINTAKDAYRVQSKMFLALSKQDFLDGYTDAIEAAYKHEKLLAL